MFLEPVKKKEIETLFFDETSKKVFSHLLKKQLFSIPEVRKIDNPIPLRIPKEYLEVWVSQMIDGDPIGSGSYPVDVISHSKSIAVDISGLTINYTPKGKFNRLTGEKSLGQKFKSENYGNLNEDLDDLFKNSKGEEIVASFAQILNKKYNKVFEDKKNITKIYILNFIFDNSAEKIYISVFKVDKDEIFNFKNGKISETTCIVENGINNHYGEIKAYKSKKRLELRLNASNLLKDGFLLETKYSFKSVKLKQVNLREVMEKDDFADSLIASSDIEIKFI